MSILAIDPSLACTGWILWRDGQIDFGAIETKPEAKKRGIYQADDTTRRAREIHDELYSILRGEVDMPQVIIERMAGTKSARAACAQGVVYGVLASLFGQEARYVSAMDAKKAMTGDRHASKESMVAQASAWLGSQYRMDFRSHSKARREAIADALGVLLAGARDKVEKQKETEA